MARTNLNSVVRNNGAFSQGEKATLEKLANGIGLILRVSADASKTSSTTQTLVDDVYTDLVRGKRYLIDFDAQFTFTASAGGIRPQLAITGTQTSAQVEGTYQVFTLATTPALKTAGAVTSVSGGLLLDVNVAGAAAESVSMLKARFSFVPAEDGRLSLTFAQSSSNASASVLKRGAVLRVTRLDDAG